MHTERWNYTYNINPTKCLACQKEGNSVALMINNNKWREATKLLVCSWYKCVKSWWCSQMVKNNVCSELFRQRRPIRSDLVQNENRKPLSWFGGYYIIYWLWPRDNILTLWDSILRLWDNMLRIWDNTQRLRDNKLTLWDNILRPWDNILWLIYWVYEIIQCGSEIIYGGYEIIYWEYETRYSI